VDFRQFLIRHAELFRFLRTWTVRLLVPRRFRKALALYKAAVREELWTPLDPSVTKALETYFPERQAQGRHLGDSDDRFIRAEFRTQGMPKIQAPYRARRRQGDGAFQDSFKTPGESLLLVAYGHDTKRARPGARVERDKLRQIDLHWHELRHKGACRCCEMASTSASFSWCSDTPTSRRRSGT
jgi:hypothetical protein